MTITAYATHEPATMFIVNGVPFVPHYRQRGIYVAPGGHTYTLMEVSAMKPKSETVALWPRPWLTKEKYEPCT
jgi:hypothetical protein